MAKTAKRPDYSVSVVAERNGKDIWTRVGVAFKNDSEDAPLTILLNPGITLTGDTRLVLSTIKSKEEVAAA